MGFCCGNSKIDTEENDKLEYVKSGRHCTNFPCLIIFIVFWALFIGLFIYGLTGNSDLYVFFYFYYIDYGMELIIMVIHVVIMIILVLLVIIVKKMVVNIYIILV